MNMFRLAFIALSIVAFSSTAEDLPKSDFDGTWEYSAQQAPEGYRTGTVSINGDEIQVVIGGYQKFTGYEVKIGKDVLSFYTYVEGSRVSVKLTMKGSEVTGTANTQDGAIPLTLKKKK